MRPLDDPRWLPVLVRRRPVPEVQWAWAEGVRLTDPFFSQSAERLVGLPANRLLGPRSGLDALLDRPPGLPVRGLVAHVSRCGSTLVSSWLAADPAHLVLCEPGPLDDVLRLRGLDHDEHVALVRGVVAALAQPRGGETGAWVKLDSWHARLLPLLRAAFPDAPVLGLVREPVEVLVSSERRRGAHMVPGALPPEDLGLTPADVTSADPEEWMARVLGGLYDGLRAGPVDLVVDYCDLLGARAVVLDLLGAPAPAGELDARTAQDAKNPLLPFTDDVASKQAAASPALRAAADRWARPAYDAVRA